MSIYSSIHEPYFNNQPSCPVQCRVFSAVDRISLDLEMGCMGFYDCVKCVRRTLYAGYGKQLLNNDLSRKITVKVIIMKKGNWGRKYRQFRTFGIFWSVFGVFRYL